MNKNGRVGKCERYPRVGHLRTTIYYNLRVSYTIGSCSDHKGNVKVSFYLNSFELNLVACFSSC